jgi:hypothetical protein
MDTLQQRLDQNMGKARGIWFMLYQDISVYEHRGGDNVYDS